MKFCGIKKIHEGKFITQYDVKYLTENNHTKVYEMISRNRNIQTLEELQNKQSNAVVMILTNETNDKILLTKEYRLAVGQWVYNFPAGLIDDGETTEIAAKRELKEETGLDLIKITDILDKSYSAVGFSNERNAVVFGIANGEFHESTSDVEEIIPNWYTKDEILSIIKENSFSARAQAYCYLWAKS